MCGTTGGAFSDNHTSYVARNCAVFAPSVTAAASAHVFNTSYVFDNATVTGGFRIRGSLVNVTMDVVNQTLVESAGVFGAIRFDNNVNDAFFRHSSLRISDSTLSGIMGVNFQDVSLDGSTIDIRRTFINATAASFYATAGLQFRGSPVANGSQVSLVDSQVNATTTASSGSLVVDLNDSPLEFNSHITLADVTATSNSSAAGLLKFAFGSHINADSSLRLVRGYFYARSGNQASGIEFARSIIDDNSTVEVVDSAFDIDGSDSGWLLKRSITSPVQRSSRLSFSNVSVNLKSTKFLATLFESRLSSGLDHSSVLIISGGSYTAVSPAGTLEFMRFDASPIHNGSGVSIVGAAVSLHAFAASAVIMYESPITSASRFAIDHTTMIVAANASRAAGFACQRGVLLSNRSQLLIRHASIMVSSQSSTTKVLELFESRIEYSSTVDIVDSTLMSGTDASSVAITMGSGAGLFHNCTFQLTRVNLTSIGRLSASAAVVLDRSGIEDSSTFLIVDGTITVQAGGSSAHAIRFSAFNRIARSSHLNVTRVVIDCIGWYDARFLEFNMNSVVERDSRITFHDVNATANNTGTNGVVMAFGFLAGGWISNDSVVDVRGGSYTCTALIAAANFVYFDTAQLDNSSRFDVIDATVNVTARNNARVWMFTDGSWVQRGSAFRFVRLTATSRSINTAPIAIELSLLAGLRHNGTAAIVDSSIAINGGSSAIMFYMQTGAIHGIGSQLHVSRCHLDVKGRTAARLLVLRYGDTLANLDNGGAVRLSDVVATVDSDISDSHILYLDTDARITNGGSIDIVGGYFVGRAPTRYAYGVAIVHSLVQHGAWIACHDATFDLFGGMRARFLQLSADSRITDESELRLVNVTAHLNATGPISPAEVFRVENSRFENHSSIVVNGGRFTAMSFASTAASLILGLGTVLRNRSSITFSGASLHAEGRTSHTVNLFNDARIEDGSGIFFIDANATSIASRVGDSHTISIESSSVLTANSTVSLEGGSFVSRSSQSMAFMVKLFDNAKVLDGSSISINNVTADISGTTLAALARCEIHSSFSNSSLILAGVAARVTSTSFSSASGGLQSASIVDLRAYSDFTFSLLSIIGGTYVVNAPAGGPAHFVAVHEGIVDSSRFVVSGARLQMSAAGTGGVSSGVAAVIDLVASRRYRNTTLTIQSMADCLLISTRATRFVTLAPTMDRYSTVTVVGTSVRVNYTGDASSGTPFDYVSALIVANLGGDGSANSQLSPFPSLVIMQDVSITGKRVSLLGLNAARFAVYEPPPGPLLMSSVNFNRVSVVSESVGVDTTGLVALWDTSQANSMALSTIPPFPDVSITFYVDGNVFAGLANNGSMLAAATPADLLSQVFPTRSACQLRQCNFWNGTVAGFPLRIASSALCPAMGSVNFIDTSLPQDQCITPTHTLPAPPTPTNTATRSFVSATASPSVSPSRPSTTVSPPLTPSPSHLFTSTTSTSTSTTRDPPNSARNATSTAGRSSSGTRTGSSVSQSQSRVAATSSNLRSSSATRRGGNFTATAMGIASRTEFPPAPAVANGRPLPVPEQLADSAVASSGTVAVAGVAGSPAAALQVARAVGVLSALSVCGTSGITSPDGPTGRLEFPKSLVPGLGLGPDVAAYHRGAIVAAVLGLVAVAVIAAVVGTLLRRLARVRPSSEKLALDSARAGGDTSPPQAVSPFIAGLRLTRMPGLLVIVAAVAADGLATTLVVLAVTGVDALDGALAFVGVAILVATMAFVFFAVGRGPGSRAVVYGPVSVQPHDAKNSKKQQPPPTDSSSSGILTTPTTTKKQSGAQRFANSNVGRWLFVGQHAWVPAPTTEESTSAVNALALTEHLGAAFGKYRGPVASLADVVDPSDDETPAAPIHQGGVLHSIATRFLVLDLVVAVAAAGFEGAVWADCTTGLVGMAATNGVGLLLALVVRPYSVPAKNLLMAVVSAVTFAAASAAALAVISEQRMRDGDTALGVGLSSPQLREAAAVLASGAALLSNVAMGLAVFRIVFFRATRLKVEPDRTARPRQPEGLTPTSVELQTIPLQSDDCRQQQQQRQKQPLLAVPLIVASTSTCGDDREEERGDGEGNDVQLCPADDPDVPAAAATSVSARRRIGGRTAEGQRLFEDLDRHLNQGGGAAPQPKQETLQPPPPSMPAGHHHALPMPIAGLDDADFDVFASLDQQEREHQQRDNSDGDTTGRTPGHGATTTTTDWFLDELLI